MSLVGDEANVRKDDEKLSGRHVTSKELKTKDAGGEKNNRYLLLEPHEIRSRDKASAFECGGNVLQAGSSYSSCSQLNGLGDKEHKQKRLGDNVRGESGDSSGAAQEDGDEKWDKLLLDMYVPEVNEWSKF